RRQPGRNHILRRSALAEREPPAERVTARLHFARAARCRQPRRPEGDASAADCRIVHHVLDNERALGRIALEPASPDGGIGSTRAIEVDAVPEPQTIPGFRIASGNEPRLVEAALGNPRPAGRIERFGIHATTLRPRENTVKRAGDGAVPRLTWTPSPVDCGLSIFPEFSREADALSFRQCLALFGDRHPVRFLVARRRAFPPSPRPHP